MSHLDVAILGGGPAGLTAAATLARQLHTVVVFDSGTYRNATTKHIHTVPGHDHKDPAEYRTTTRAQIMPRYSTVEFVDVEVTQIKKENDSSFKIRDKSGKTREFKKVILAIGSCDMLPSISGYEQLWMRNIYHCLFCLGYEERGADATGVLAQSIMADNAAQLSKEVTIFTNGSEEVAAQLSAIAPQSPFKVDTRSIAHLSEVENGVAVQFSDGTSKHVAFLVHNPLTYPQGPFVKQLELELTATGDIKADAPTYQTSSRGLFAAGDCISPFKVIPHAIASGNFAAVAGATQLQAEKYGHFSMV